MIERPEDPIAALGVARGFYWLSPPTSERGGLAGMACPTEAHLARLPELRIGQEGQIPLIPLWKAILGSEEEWEPPQ